MNTKEPAVHARARGLATRHSTTVTDAVRQALRAAVVHLSAASPLELRLVAESARQGIEATEVEQLLLSLRVEVMPFDQQQLHRAGLHLGDCFSYGLAQALNAPLLFKGNDFDANDVTAALPS